MHRSPLPKKVNKSKKPSEYLKTKLKYNFWLTAAYGKSVAGKGKTLRGTIRLKLNINEQTKKKFSDHRLRLI